MRFTWQHDIFRVLATTDNNNNIQRAFKPVYEIYSIYFFHKFIISLYALV